MALGEFSYKFYSRPNVEKIIVMTKKYNNNSDNNNNLTYRCCNMDEYAGYKIAFYYIFLVLLFCFLPSVKDKYGDVDDLDESESSSSDDEFAEVC